MLTIVVILNGICVLGLYAVFRVWAGQIRAKAAVLEMLHVTGDRADSFGCHRFHRFRVLT